MAVYCLWCETGCENRVGAGLERLGCRVIPAKSEELVVHRGISKKVWRQLLPGYVLFESSEPLNPLAWKRIYEDEHIYKALDYADGTRELMGNDLRFALMLKRRNGRLAVSKAVRTGTKIKIIDGPLKELEGKIIKVNKRRNCAEIEINASGIINRMWLGFEMIKREEE
jgi:transcriptional antiterminator NusG